jgi:hypothetical protein
MLLARAPHDYPAPGEWAPYDAEGEQTVVVCCPECGHRESLEAYSIDQQGRVTPGVRCNDGCGWYARTVQLQGWRLN